MGMAASQARLLCLTARIHDIEFQAQAIQHSKLQLATQSDQVYEEYIDALDATTLTVNSVNLNNGTTSLISATFNNLCSSRRIQAADGNIYALRNRNGYLIVEDDIEDAYYNFTQYGLSDAYHFALYMMNGGNVNHIGNLDNGEYLGAIENAELEIYNSHYSVDETREDTLNVLYDKLYELVTRYAESPSDVTSIYDTNVLYSNGSIEEQQEYKETLLAYRQELYRLHGSEIYETLEADSRSSEEFNQADFNYYVSIYNQIKACGGCVSISEYDGPNGDAANNSEWLENMVRSGQISIDCVTTDKLTGKISLETTSPSSNISLNYTTTTEIDATAAKKAEAEYEHKLKQINKKDQQFDLDLSKLETERQALKTELESTKKVITENIDRSFKIFS